VMPQSMRCGQQLATSRAGELTGVALARLAGAGKPDIRWRITQGPWFDNMLSALEFDGRAARIRFDRAAADPSGNPSLQPVCEMPLLRETPLPDHGSRPQPGPAVGSERG